MIDFLRDGIVAHVFAAGLGLDGEAGRHGQAPVGPLDQSGAFAAQLVLHFAVAFGVSVAEEVDVFDGVGVSGRRGFNLAGRSAHDDVLCYLLLNIATNRTAKPFLLHELSLRAPNVSGSPTSTGFVLVGVIGREESAFCTNYGTADPSLRS